MHEWITSHWNDLSPRIILPIFLILKSFDASYSYKDQCTQCTYQAGVLSFTIGSQRVYPRKTKNPCDAAKRQKRICRNKVAYPTANTPKSQATPRTAHEVRASFVFMRIMFLRFASVRWSFFFSMVITSVVTLNTRIAATGRTTPKYSG